MKFNQVKTWLMIAGLLFFAFPQTGQAGWFDNDAENAIAYYEGYNRAMAQYAVPYKTTTNTVTDTSVSELESEINDLQAQINSLNSQIDNLVIDSGDDSGNFVSASTWVTNPMKQDLDAAGYDIFDLNADAIPNKDQVREIWFTFNYVTNFLRHPSLFSGSTLRVRNAVSWYRALSEAYEENPIIDCLIYYLEKKLNETSHIELDEIRTRAICKIKNSKQWQVRDKQFSFSSFLDNCIPFIDKRAEMFSKIKGGIVDGI